MHESSQIRKVLLLIANQLANQVLVLDFISYRLSTTNMTYLQSKTKLKQS